MLSDYMVGDLGEIIRNWENPLNEAQSKSYSLQLLRGLSFIHSQKIIHRIVITNCINILCYIFIRRATSPSI